MPVAVSTSMSYLVPPVAEILASVGLGKLPILPELLIALIVISGVVIISQGRA